MNRTPTRQARERLVAALTAGLLGLAAAAATAQATMADETAFVAAVAVFRKAADGAGSVDTARHDLAELAQAAPDDLVTQAYLGAATAMQARDTLLPWRKMSLAEDGLALLDKALGRLGPAHDAPGHRGTPTSLEVRFVAASTFIALPSMFNRHARGLQLLAEVTAHPAFAASPLDFRGSVWLRAAQSAHDEGRAEEARGWLDRAIAAGAPQAAQAQRLRQEWKP